MSTDLAVTGLPTEDALDMLARTSAAAFAIDRKDRIVYWNAGAERLLGWSAEEMLGRFCFDALKGRDPFGNLYCSSDCPIVKGAVKGQYLEPYLMTVRTKSGATQSLRIRAVPLPGTGDGFSCLMHLIDEGDAQVGELVERLRASARGELPAPPPDPPISVSPLTPREREILLLLSNGYAALNIAARLNLSHATVRNHIQNILRKMEVHSQVEAIAVAFRRGWI